jgi:hypothetical protein
MTNPLAAVREPGMHARSLPYTLLPIDMTRIATLPSGRALSAPDGAFELVDVRENVDVVTSSCEPFGDRTLVGSPCFWTPGEETAELVLWGERSTPPDRVFLRAGPRRTRATVALGRDRAQVRLLPDQALAVRLAMVGPGFPVRLHGRDGWAWILEIRSSHAFQPALAGVGRDRHWLGVQAVVPPPAGPNP